MKPKTKDTIIVVLMGIALISFLVVLWGFIIHQTIWGMLAVPVFCFSFVIALVLGMPKSKGPIDHWRGIG